MDTALDDLREDLPERGGAPVPVDKTLMARCLSYVLGAIAVLALVGLIVPRSAGDSTLLVPIAALAAIGAALLPSSVRLLPLWSYQLILAGLTALVSALIYASHDMATGTGHSILYVLVALYAAYFLTRPQAALQLVLIAIGYAASTVAQSSGGAEIVRWITVVASVWAAAWLVGLLKGRLERLIERLTDAALTDVLTGLLNRRGFQELFETELERARRSGRPLSLIVGDIDRFKALNDRFGHSGGDQALEQLSAILRAAKRRIDTPARIGGEEFALIVPESTEHDAYILAERLRMAVRDAFDRDHRVTISFGIATFPHHGGTTEALLHAADQALYAAKELGRDRSVIHNAGIATALAEASSRRKAEHEGYLSTVLALAEALDMRESGSARHSKAVARYAELAARELALPEDLVGRVRLGAILHDVGKIGVPEAVRRKQGPLSADEWSEIKKHPEIAAHILEGTSVGDVRTWVLLHHERPDGRGYPRGLVGDAIPLEARILAVADAYEAMTSERAYRPAMTPLEAGQELREAAGTQFDESVVSAFLRALERLGPAAVGA